MTSHRVLGYHRTGYMSGVAKVAEMEATHVPNSMAFGSPRPTEIPLPLNVQP